MPALLLALAALVLQSTPARPAAAPERVTVTTATGAMLVGYYRDAGANTPAVLFFPMCRADATEGWAPVADRLLALGVSSLTVPPRGFGERVGPATSGDPTSADADGAFAYLQSRVGTRVAIAVAGSSCGVYKSLLTAQRHADAVRAAVVLTGPYVDAQLEHVRKTPGLAVFAAAAREDDPAPGWARELAAASTHQASEVALADGKAHGTDVFATAPAFAARIATWLADRLTQAAVQARGPVLLHR
jgi:alpha/beta superfamily hydrolase